MAPHKGTRDPTTRQPSSTVRLGGRYIPSITRRSPFRVLVVFVRFHGDTLRTPIWPEPDALPEWASSILSRRASDVTRYPENLSRFFFENSCGLFTIVGDVYLVTTDSTEDYFHERVQGTDEDIRAAIIREVLGKLDDPDGPYRVDFRRYDNWSTSADFRHEPTPDGWIDMVWIITRTFHGNPYAPTDPRFKRFRHFGRVSADFNVGRTPLVLDGVRVGTTSGVVRGRGSGIMVFDHTAGNRAKLLDTSRSVSGRTHLYGEIIHEISHYLFGSGHFGNSDIALSPVRYTSYFSGYSITNGNAYGNLLGYERMRLGWVSEKERTLRVVRPRENDVTVTLKDCALSKRGSLQVVKVAVPNSDQFFLLEYRGWKGPFEPRIAPYNGLHAVLRPGLLVTHVIEEKEHFASTPAKILCADGRYRWRVVRLADIPGDRDAGEYIERGEADPVEGYDEREKIFAEGAASNPYLAGFWPRPSGKPQAVGPYPSCTNCVDPLTEAADNVGDRYDLFGEGDVITPWSNPSLLVWTPPTFSHPEGLPIGVHVIDVDPQKGTCTVRITRGRFQGFPPARPTGVRVESRTDSGWVFRWSPNRDPLIADPHRHGRYIVERSFDGERYSPIGETEHPSCIFVDREKTDATVPFSPFYRVRAVSRDGTKSRPSEPARFWNVHGRER
ncbi:MAG: hypothetical protein QHI48_01815 [Bacteroidota bacterium]|nr:hypothetical protein [Bacteroidota bacterium]